MKANRRIGCMAIILIAIGVAFAVSRTEAGSYIFSFVALFFAMFIASLVTSPDWHVTEARVEKATIHSHEIFGQYGSVTLVYDDDEGDQHRQTVRISSPSKRLGSVSVGQGLPIKVCRYDPAIISSARLAILGKRACEPSQSDPAANIVRQ